MSVITAVILCFSLLGAVDYVIGNKIGVGTEFVRAFSLFCPMVLTMLGMIVIAPAVGVWFTPFFEGFYNVFKIDPSILPASVFANDMGGMQLAQAVARDKAIGDFNAFVISSMMGCVISFTIPFSLGIVKKEQHGELFFGLLCGIATIPIGSIVAGLVCGLSLITVIISILPMIVISVIVIVALILAPKACVKYFSVFGAFMKIVAMIGLVLAIFTFLTKIEISEHFDTFENGAFICANACVTLSGALPAMFIISRLLDKPLSKLCKKVGINSISMLALLGNTVTNATSLGSMDKMDKKGVVLNAAFAVSAAFTFGGHLAFTMAFDQAYVGPMMVGKLVSGAFALVLVFLIYKEKEEPAVTEEAADEE